MADEEDYGEPSAKRSNNSETTPKRREKSAIWKYFVKTTSSTAQCTTCGATLQTPTGTTTTLANHLKQHPAAVKEYRKIAAGAPGKDQSTLSDFVRRAEPLSEKKTQALHNKVAAMVALDLQPYSVVEDRGFKELMAEAVPNYRLPSRTTLSRALVPRLYDDTRKKVKAELSSAFEGGTAAVAFTSDMWTSRANESYVSFTCHFLTPTFQMKRFTLNTRHMAASHSAGNIAELLGDMCDEWEIPDDCQKYIVTDNGRNIRAAVRRLPWTERPCFAHTLQLAINDAISCTPSIDRLCKKARHIVGHYKHSSSAQRRLEEYQKRTGKDPLRLVQDVETRWNSQYLMLSRLLDMKEAVTVELATSNSSIDGLSSQEWKEASEYVKVLKPFYDATVIASAERYPSLSAQVPIIFGMLNCLSNFSGITEFHKELAASIKTRFPLYAEDKEACLAMFLDPRFKSTIFKPNKQNMMWLKDLVLQDLALCPRVDTTDSEARKQEPKQSAQHSCDVWDAFDDLANSQAGNKALSSSEWEIAAYSEEALLGKESDPCSWWQTVGSFRYPSLAKLCLKYLAIPATSVPSERAFSVAGEVVSAKRERLLPDHVEQLIFLHDNF